MTTYYQRRVRHLRPPRRELPDRWPATGIVVGCILGGVIWTLVIAGLYAWVA